MDEESVISVSSVSSVSRRASPSVGASSESLRAPVSWEDATNNSKRLFNVNNVHKVKEWMKSCGDTQTTCIRYDFDKGPSGAGPPVSCYTRTTPLPSYMEEAKKSGHRANGGCEGKRELCSYLKLMPPGQSPENRRSVRVRNQSFARKIDFEELEKVVTDVVKVVDDVVKYPTLKSFQDLNVTLEKVESYLKTENKYLPLPEKKFREEVVDFEDSIREIVAEVSRNNNSTNKLNNGAFRNRKKLLRIKKRRLKSLRSKGSLRDIPLDTLILRKSHLMKRAMRRRLMAKKQQEPEVVKVAEKTESPRCEIISVHYNSDDENIDLRNFVDDMLELDKMSEEHRKNIIESRILASSSITNLINKQTNKEENVQRAIKIFSDISNERKNSEEKENAESIDENNLVSIMDHNYAMSPSHLHSELEEEEETDEEEEEENSQEENQISPVPIPDLEILPVNKNIKIKSLYRSLTLTNKRKLYSTYPHHNSSKLNHSITISQKNGPILKAFYQDCHLVVVQQNLVAFWTQSSLGHVLGAQNMWVPDGECHRLPLNSTYRRKEAAEMVVSTETSVAYVELWTKEHKSDIREVPVADVFATVYFWRLRQSGLDKKVLQLENIKGYADDVAYCVLRGYPRVVVSWHSVQGGEKTKIHAYHLAADFQTVASISEIQPVEHCVSSLHTIEDCDNLIMGCGENKVTLWNIEYGYIVATIELSNINSPLSTLWVKGDRGFLFTIQECVDQELRLIAINGMNHSWKKLQNYNPPTGFEGLKGVCIEHGVLFAYYSQGIVCWDAQSGELLVEEVRSECEYIPSGKHVIIIINDKIIVRHSLSHLVTGHEC